MRKQGAQSAKQAEKPRKSPRLNKNGRRSTRASPMASTRRGAAKDAQPIRAVRSMKFNEVEKDQELPFGSGRRANLRSPNTRKAAERASEDIAVELILEDETLTDDDSRMCAFESKGGHDGQLEGNNEIVNSNTNKEADSQSNGVTQRRGRKPKRKRGGRKANDQSTSSDSLQHDKGSKNIKKESLDEDNRQDSGDDSDADVRSNSSNYAPPPVKKAKTKTGILEKLQDSTGFVDRVELSMKAEDLVPMKRTPRMASLNALAKVNAVLEAYSPAAAKSAGDAKKPLRDKKYLAYSSSRGDRRERKSLSGLSLLDKKDDSFISAREVSRRRCNSLSANGDFVSYYRSDHQLAYWDEMFGNENSGHHQEINMYRRGLIDDELNCGQGLTCGSLGDKPISDNHVSSTSPWFVHDSRSVTKKDKAVQTIVNHKAVQTDSYLLQGYKGSVDSRQRTCRCGKRKILNYDTTDPTKRSHNRLFHHIPPRVSSPQVDVPLQSSLFAKTDLHTIAIPFTKRHILSHTDMRDFQDLGTEHLDINRNKRMASLNAMAMMNAMAVLDQPYSALVQSSLLYHQKQRAPLMEKQEGAPLKIPKINYAATSTSNFSSSNKTRGPVPSNYRALQLRNIPSSVEKLVGKRIVPSSPKMVNGWMFDGEPVEKPYEYDDRIVLRRYYTSMSRNNEVINVRDSVLLKSGTKKKDIPFVARVAAIWEEENGDTMGDMMISVFWYYRPEQTEIGRLPNFHGEMEVLASRHRDDNSVACIVDKCYVLSYPQYCRFRARSKLHRESRRTPLSPVPPSESTRPGSMPPPNTDPTLVFFCRQVYDFRTGRVLKNPFY